MQRQSDAVFFIGMNYPTGGILHFAHLANELHRNRQRTFDFYLVSIDHEANIGFWNTVFSVIPAEKVIRGLTFSDLIDQIYRLAGNYRRVIIHTGGGWGQTREVLRVRRKFPRNLVRRVLLVGTTHSFRIGEWKRIPMSMIQYVLYRLCYTKIIFQCEYAKRRFVGGRSLVSMGKGVVVPLGCEDFPMIVDCPPALSDSSELVQALSEKSTFKFVYLAQFRAGKMHDWLVEAFIPVLQKYPQVRLVLCGGGDQRLMALSRRLANGGGVGKQVIMPGQVAREAVPWILRHVDCAVVPSRAETFGHNFLEPMFAGVPVLGTHVGIGQEVIKDGETGYFFDLRDLTSLQEAACRLIDNPGHAREMGTTARDLVSTRFCHSDVAERLIVLYEQVLNK